MKTLHLNIPDQLNADEVSRFLAAKLYEAGKLTLAQAAQMVDMRTVEFAEILAQYEVSLFNYPASDIAKDAANAHPKAGCMKGTFIMRDNFDEPLDDFKEYTS
jgi:predicted HTH domain antitoxin